MYTMRVTQTDQKALHLGPVMQSLLTGPTAAQTVHMALKHCVIHYLLTR